MTTARADGERPSVPPADVVALGLSLLARPLLAAVPGLDLGFVASEAIKLTVAGCVLAIAIGWRGRSLAAVGVRRPALRDAGWALVVAVVGVGSFVLGAPLVEALGLPTAGAEPLLDEGSVALALASAVNAGVTEEVLFRGYPIERIAETDLGVYGAGAVTLLLFTVAHVPGYPLGNVVLVGAVALGLTAVYVRRRRLAPVIAGHVLIDVVGVLAAAFG